LDEIEHISMYFHASVSEYTGILMMPGVFILNFANRLGIALC